MATGSRSGAGHWSARDVGPLGSLAACRCRGGKPRHARGLARGAGLLVGCAANAPASVVATMAAVAWAPPSLASCVATRRSIARKRARNPRGATRLAGVRALASPSRGNMPDQRHHPAGSRERAAAGPAPQGGKTLNADEGTLPRNSLRPRARAHPQQRVITRRTAERRAPKPEPVATWKTVVATSTPAESFDHRSADLTALESSSLSSGAGRATAGASVAMVAVALLTDRRAWNVGGGQRQRLPECLLRDVPQAGFNACGRTNTRPARRRSANGQPARRAGVAPAREASTPGPGTGTMLARAARSAAAVTAQSEQARLRPTGGKRRADASACSCCVPPARPSAWLSSRSAPSPSGPRPGRLAARERAPTPSPSVPAVLPQALFPWCRAPSSRRPLLPALRSTPRPLRRRVRPDPGRLGADVRAAVLPLAGVCGSRAAPSRRAIGSRRLLDLAGLRFPRPPARPQPRPSPAAESMTELFAKGKNSAGAFRRTGAPVMAER